METADKTIRIGTKEEKYDAMKEQLIKRGKWNVEEEAKLRTALGMEDAKVEVVTEDPPVKSEKTEPVKKVTSKKK